MSPTRLLALALAALPCPAVIAQTAPQAATAEPQKIEGILPDGTHWRVQWPDKWNGTLVLDLDGAGFRAPPPGTTLPAGIAATPPGMPPFNQWLLEQGYAYGGITREPVGYDFPKALDYLLDVRTRFIAARAKPRRTLLIGGSRGAFVVRKGLELHPAIFDGGMMNSGGGAGEIAVLNNKLAAVFALKTLVDPQSPMTLVNIDLPAEQAALSALLAKALASPAGRVRLALAAGVEQFSLWSVRDKPRPAPTDYDAQLDQIGESFIFATALPVRAGVEKVASGNVSWNTGVDYRALLDRSGRRAMVEALYAKAGLDLERDLATLAAAPRISADPAAVRRAEPLMTYTGRISDPVINVDNDDPVDPASDKLVYRDTLERAGTAGLFRLIWADMPGHGGQSPLDRAVAFSLLVDRIDRGRWADTALPALRTRGQRIAAASKVNLGALSLFDPEPLPQPAGSWDVANWGSYKP